MGSRDQTKLTWLLQFVPKREHFRFFATVVESKKNNTVRLNHISICDTIRQLAGGYEHLQKIGNVPTKNRQASTSENYSAN